MSAFRAFRWVVLALTLLGSSACGGSGGSSSSATADVGVSGCEIGVSGRDGATLTCDSRDVDVLGPPLTCSALSAAAKPPLKML